MSASQIFLLVAVIRLAGLVLVGLLLTALPHRSGQVYAAASARPSTAATMVHDDNFAAQLSDMRLHD